MSKKSYLVSDPAPISQKNFRIRLGTLIRISFSFNKRGGEGVRTSVYTECIRGEYGKKKGKYVPSNIVNWNAFFYNNARADPH